MLRELELTSVIRDEVLLITTPEEADNFVEVRVYEVSDLVRTPDDKSSDGVPDFDSVADIIATSINPTGWGACSGPPPIYPLTIPGVDMIVFGQTQAAHEEVEALLAQLRAVRHMSKGSRSESLKLPLQGTTSPLVAETPLCPPVAPAMAAIRRALVKPLDVKYDNVPLEKVAADIQAKLGIPVRLDNKALKNAKVSTLRPSRSPSQKSRRGLRWT